MQQSIPKQYLQLLDRTVLEWSIAPFLSHSACAGVVVVIAADDVLWSTSPLSRHPSIRAVQGGRERADSVQAGILALRSECRDEDWVLVHDAARACLDPADLQRLLDCVGDDQVGGLLAVPVVDTLKRADDSGRVVATAAREGLWRALTPQMFRYGVLLQALQNATRAGATITDESQAVELLGFKPQLVTGSGDNFKITLPEDIARAERLLTQRLST